MRQGDLLSPYLFVIKGSSNPNFQYHWRTKHLGITHLCFVDDLILFCHGDKGSVSTLKECLLKFESLSGLVTNAGKSMCFLSNVPQEQASHIIDTLRFQIGTLPAKFLGVPLTSTKLCSADCYPLIEKITRELLHGQTNSSHILGDCS